MKNKNRLTIIGIWLMAFMFPILMIEKLSDFINTGSLSIYWLIVPILISIGVLFKSKIMRWIMLFGIYLSFFYEFIGTKTGMTCCLSNNLMTLVHSWSFATFIDIFPHLLFIIMTHLFYIFLLTHKESYKYFNLNEKIRIHEIGILGINAFSVMYFNVIYWLF